MQELKKLSILWLYSLWLYSLRLYLLWQELNERLKKHGGGFAEEVRSKYDGGVFELFVELFERLPLAFLVGGKALVVHGGLSRHRGVCLSHLRRLSQRQQCPEAPQSFEDYLFFDLLWSDPHPDDAEGVHESARGDGCILFGRDMTLDFLQTNSLQLLVRSHQVPSDGHGYEVVHDGRCVEVATSSSPSNGRYRHAEHRYRHDGKVAFPTGASPSSPPPTTEEPAVTPAPCSCGPTP